MYLIIITVAIDEVIKEMKKGSRALNRSMRGAVAKGPRKMPRVALVKISPKASPLSWGGQCRAINTLPAGLNIVWAAPSKAQPMRYMRILTALAMMIKPRRLKHEANR